MRTAKVAFVILILLGVYVGGCNFQAGYRRHRVCIDCGRYSQVREYFGLSIPGMSHRTELTDWYDRKIAKLHAHRWERTCGKLGLNIWGWTMGRSCRTAESIAGDYCPFTSALEVLEPLGLDLPVYRALTHPERPYRAAAAEAVRHLFCFKWSEGESKITAWWEKTRRYLDTPGAWSQGFENF